MMKIKKKNTAFLLIITLIFAITFSSCSLSSIYYLTGDVFDYSYEYLCDTLKNDIEKKLGSQRINVCVDSKPVKSSVIKEDIDRFISENSYGVYFIKNIAFSLKDNETFSKIDMKIKYSDAKVKFDDIIDASTLTNAQMVSRAVQNLRSGSLVTAYHITDSSQDGNLAGSLINTIDQNAGIGFTFDSYFYSYYPTTGNDRILQLEFCSDIPKEQQTNLNELLEKKLDKVADQIKSQTDVKNENDVCKKIHDYILEHVEYDDDVASESVKTQSARIERSTYGAMILGKTICGGYSEAFLRLHEKVTGNSNCWIMAGYAGTGENRVGHAWNMVRIDGKDYYIDCTYDDTAKTNDYFMKLPGSKEFSDHEVAQQYIKGW